MEWFQYNGETTDKLLGLEREFRLDSLVVAFEEGLLRRSTPLTRQETYVVAVEALEREVNNGGYAQFFLNSSNEYVGMIADALKGIGCPLTEKITRKAIDALHIGGRVSPERVEAALEQEDPGIAAALAQCDAEYQVSGEDIAARLFAWIKQNRAAIQVGKNVK